MTNIVQKIYANGRVEDCKEGEKMDLAQMQAFVGGYIEMVRTSVPRRMLVVNEEGLLENLPVNPAATALVAPEVLHYGIRGNALLVKGK